MNMLKLLGAVAAVAAAAAGAARADTVIRISSWASPQHHMNSVVFPTWGKWVEEATEGRVTVKIEYDLGPPPAQIDLVRDGIADMTWAFHGYNPGRFIATQIVELPGLDVGSEAKSRAYWRIHQKYLARAGEHEGVMVIGLMAHGPGHMHLKQPIDSLADLKGRKIRIGGGISAQVGQVLGVVGVQVPAPKVYETVATGVADGVFMPMETKKSFRLAEVAPYTVMMPGGLYDGSFVLAMNPDTFASLSKQDQEAVMGVSGEKLSGMAGRSWHEADEAGLEFAKAQGNTVVTASEEMQQEFARLVAPIERQWVEQASEERGIDAAKALAELREVARSLAAQ